MELDSLVHFYFREGLATSTRKTYEAGKKKFIQFCTEFNISNPLPVNQQTLCYYVAYLAKLNLSPATIKVYLSALRHYHIANDVPEPDRAKMQKLKIVSNGITRVSAVKTRETHTRLPITPDILRQIYRLWQPSRHEYETILMWAVSTLCFFGFFRMGELTIPNDTAYDYSLHLSPGDIATDSHTNPTMLQVHLKSSKTDRDCKGTTVIVGRTGDLLCPVSAVLAYLAIRGTTPGPLFQLENGVPLTKTRFILKFREALTQIGIDASKYAGHSFRIGAATTAAQHGIEDSVIQRMGRWKTTAYLSYIQPPKEFLTKLSGILSSTNPTQ